jgi:putative ABC transport system permease protein
MQFIVRSSLEPGALLPAIRKAIASVDGTIPVAQVRTVDDLVAASSANARFVTRFMTGFGVVALVLAAIGVYGVIGYGVQQRRQEFGVRRALGAMPREIVQLVLRQSVRGTAAGIGIGLGLALAAGFGLRHLLFDVSPFDPLTFVGAVGLIVGTSIAASLIPALSAARVEPRAALEE